MWLLWYTRYMYTIYGISIIILLSVVDDNRCILNHGGLLVHRFETKQHVLLAPHPFSSQRGSMVRVETSAITTVMVAETSITDTINYL